jgi:hypothetical protein
MPKALTPQEKMEKVEAKIEAKEVKKTRGKRATFNGTQGKLHIAHQIEGYHTHIFNDSPGRIAFAQDVGYEFVSPDEIGGVSINVVSRNTDVGDKVRFLVGTAETGEALYAYLMKIRQEFYEEDQNEAQAKIDLVDEAIRGGRLTGDGQSADHRYDAGIKISR